MRPTNLIHPGVILVEEFLKPLGMSQSRLAIALRVPATRINAIVRGERAITADTALRLARFFGMTPEFWLNLQRSYDLGVAKNALAAVLPTITILHGTGDAELSSN